MATPCARCGSPARDARFRRRRRRCSRSGSKGNRKPRRRRSWITSRAWCTAKQARPTNRSAICVRSLVWRVCLCGTRARCWPGTRWPRRWARVVSAIVLLGLLLAASTVLPTHGIVRTDSLWSSALGVTKQYLVYLPPSYATNTSRRYPVAYYLHGLNGDETNWVQLGHLDLAMDSLIADGGPEMIVVMPDGDNSWYTTWNSMGNDNDCKRDTTRKEPASQFC